MSLRGFAKKLIIPGMALVGMNAHQFSTTRYDLKNGLTPGQIEYNDSAVKDPLYRFISAAGYPGRELAYRIHEIRQEPVYIPGKSIIV